MKGKLLVAVTLFMILATAVSAYGMRFDGPYRGRVVDAETNEPLEGVVILGVWNTETITPGGATHRFHDAHETLTDKRGEFEIPGKGFKILSNVTPMDVLIFKSGYEHIGLCPWDSLKEDLILRKKIKWEGKRAIIPLRKLTMEERRKKGTPDIFVGERFDERENMTHSCLPKNINYLPKEVNKELVQQGLKPYKLEGGLCE